MQSAAALCSTPRTRRWQWNTTKLNPKQIENRQIYKRSNSKPRQSAYICAVPFGALIDAFTLRKASPPASEEPPSAAKRATHSLWHSFRAATTALSEPCSALTLLVAKYICTPPCRLMSTPDAEASFEAILSNRFAILDSAAVPALPAQLGPKALPCPCWRALPNPPQQAQVLPCIAQGPHCEQ